MKIVLAIAVLLTLPVFAAGCGTPSVNGVCDELEGRSCTVFTGKGKCKSSGTELRSRSTDAGCDQQFQDYLQCLDDSTSCNWEGDCAGERTVLESCLGGPI